ncbi:transketolase-like TK C-terminal-containing protein [Acidiphilium sp.]|uniref:transketolase-like TK C-terminal-containing protein n=1 Tax=Acidiphilium sp. TaxID=527 RepID=UPI00338D890C
MAALPRMRRALLDRLREGELPPGWQEKLRDWVSRAAGEAMAGINASSAIVDLLAEAIPELVSGAPDLEGPTQHKRRLRAFTATDEGGRYVHYGVREHAMGAMLNGMAAHGGVVPLGVTYLVFSDYERPAIRLAAMMGLPVKFVFSHDSIGIGRNGPTHQPVEFLSSLRAIPNLLVLRPADAVEAAEAWEMALRHRDGPCALIFSRQVLPPVRHQISTENRVARGGYILAEAEGGERQVTLIGTGSEVAIALAAREVLQGEGVPTAVVSLPCWEIFSQQDPTYRAAVLGFTTVRVAVEAAVRHGWERWIGEDGGFIGMSGYGASGPEDELLAHFGITAERVVAEARSRL